MTYTDRFGYLPVDAEIPFEGGRIEPLKDFADSITRVVKYTHPDGYIYPPTIHTRTHKPGWKRDRKVPQSERPALLHTLPPTHALILDQDFANEEEARYSTAGFVVHFVGFLYGFRCQFHDWWMDGRANAKGRTDHSQPRVSQSSATITRAATTWRGFRRRQRLVAINCLFLHTRTCVHEL